MESEFRRRTEYVQNSLVDNGEEDEIDIIGVTKEAGENSKSQLSLSGKVEEENISSLNAEELASSNSACCTDCRPCEATEIQSKISTTFVSNMNSLRTDLTSVERFACNSFSTNSSTSSSSRRSSINSTDKYSKDNGVGKLEWFDNELQVMGQYSQLSDDEYDDFTPSEPYERFFFESDYLALKDNKQ